MRPAVAVIYNEPDPGRYGNLGEAKAVSGVMESVEAVIASLLELGYLAVRVPLSPPIERARETLKGLKAELAFNLFEGFPESPETEAEIAGVLEDRGLPFTGCPGKALALALDKAKTKALLAANSIKNPRYQMLCPETLSSFELNFPCIVKPVGEDASHGLTEESVVHDRSALERQVAKISRLYGGQALVEEFIDGREFNISVLGGREAVALPVSEIVFSLPGGSPRILTYAAKWEEGSPYFEGTKAVCPAEIDDRLCVEISATASRAFGLVCGTGYARVDFRMDVKGKLYVIEVNPNPDISPSAGAARQAKAAGMSYQQFVEKLVGLALEGKSR
ncbi:MAG: ATP-grasp domain-containing protein [Chloroflexi bacterium]|nr:ATP-grasp domain-containing protein [Chloroflexota bacterium]